METAKLFMSGNSQAVRLPKSYRYRWNESKLYENFAWYGYLYLYN